MRPGHQIIKFRHHPLCSCGQGLVNPGTIRSKTKAGDHFLFLTIQVSFCKLSLSHALPFTYSILTVYVGFNVQPSKLARRSTVTDKSLKWRDISG